MSVGINVKRLFWTALLLVGCGNGAESANPPDQDSGLGAGGVGAETGAGGASATGGNPGGDGGASGAAGSRCVDWRLANYAYCSPGSPCDELCTTATDCTMPGSRCVTFCESDADCSNGWRCANQFLSRAGKLGPRICAKPCKLGGGLPQTNSPDCEGEGACNAIDPTGKPALDCVSTAGLPRVCMSVTTGDCG
jgi:hypothetical protein